MCKEQTDIVHGEAVNVLVAGWIGEWLSGKWYIWSYRTGNLEVALLNEEALSPLSWLMNFFE